MDNIPMDSRRSWNRIWSIVRHPSQISRALPWYLRWFAALEQKIRERHLPPEPVKLLTCIKEGSFDPPQYSSYRSQNRDLRAGSLSRLGTAPVINDLTITETIPCASNTIWRIVLLPPPTSALIHSSRKTLHNASFTHIHRQAQHRCRDARRGPW